MCFLLVFLVGLKGFRLIFGDKNRITNLCAQCAWFDGQMRKKKLQIGKRRMVMLNNVDPKKKMFYCCNAYACLCVCCYCTYINACQVMTLIATASILKTLIE